MTDENVGLAELTSENQNLKNKMAVVLVKLESAGISEIEEQVAVLMTNMMNFFSKYVDDIPSFDLLSPKQQEAMLLKFKKVAHSLKQRNIKSIDEMLQTFVFTVLSALEERVETIENLTAAEIMNKKSKAGFKSFLKKAINHEIYKINHDEKIAHTKNKDFIHNAILLGVKEAMHLAKLDIKHTEINKEAFSLLEKAHNQFKKLRTITLEK